MSQSGVGTGPLADLSAEGSQSRADVNGDGRVSPLDALLIINALRGYRGQPDASELGDRLDVDGDQEITGKDFDYVVSYLDAQSHAQTTSPAPRTETTTTLSDPTLPPPEPISEPPIANNDTAYSWRGETIGIYVLSNDTDPENETLTITSATQPSQGTTTIDTDFVMYQANSDATGSDSFTYTIEDAYGNTDTATVTITFVTVSDWTLERQLMDGSWVAVPDGELSWSHDPLRWTPVYAPSSPLEVWGFTWLKDDHTDTTENWEVFADVPDGPAYANPGPGRWDIKTVVMLQTPVQTPFSAVMDAPKAKDVAEVVSIEWAPIVASDGKSNMTDDNPADMGDGWRVFPGRNHISLAEPDHRTQGFKVTITPAIDGTPIKIALKDPDDPSDSDGPIDSDPNYNDNVSGGLLDLPASVTTKDAIATGQFRLPLRHPGDNFRLLAAGRDVYFSQIKEITRADDPNTTTDESERLGRLYRDTNGNNIFDSNESMIDETSPLMIDVAPVVHSTPLLTLWRYVRVEVDSMGVIAAGDPDDDAGDNHAPLAVGTDVADPDIGAMEAAYRAAYIQIEPVREAVHEGNLPFQVGFNTESAALTYARDHRQSVEDEEYWSTYIVGIYEYGFLADNDLNAEFAWTGATSTTAQVDDPSFIPMEIVADVADQHGWTAEQRAKVQQILAVHEIGHQFGLEHETDLMLFPDHIMSVPQNDPDEALIPQLRIEFKEEDIRKIRQDQAPKGP